MQNTTAIRMISCSNTLPVAEDMKELPFSISGVVWQQFGYEVVYRIIGHLNHSHCHFLAGERGFRNILTYHIHGAVHKPVHPRLHVSEVFLEKRQSVSLDRYVTLCFYHQAVERMVKPFGLHLHVC